MQYEDSLALVDTGYVDVEIAHIRSEGVKVNHKDQCITADLAGIISTEEAIFGCGNVLAGSTIYCRVLFENPNINGSLWQDAFLSGCVDDPTSPYIIDSNILDWLLPVRHKTMIVIIKFFINERR